MESSVLAAASSYTWPHRRGGVIARFFLHANKQVGVVRAVLTCREALRAADLEHCISVVEQDEWVCLSKGHMGQFATVVAFGSHTVDDVPIRWYVDEFLFSRRINHWLPRARWRLAARQLVRIVGQSKAFAVSTTLEDRQRRFNRVVRFRNDSRDDRDEREVKHECSHDRGTQCQGLEPNSRLTVMATNTVTSRTSSERHSTVHIEFATPNLPRTRRKASANDTRLSLTVWFLMKRRRERQEQTETSRNEIGASIAERQLGKNARFGRSSDVTLPLGGCAVTEAARPRARRQRGSRCARSCAPRSHPCAGLIQPPSRRSSFLGGARDLRSTLGVVPRRANERVNSRPRACLPPPAALPPPPAGSATVTCVMLYRSRPRRRLV